MNRADLNFQLSSVISLGVAVVVAMVSLLLSVTFQVPDWQAPLSRQILPSRYSIPFSYDTPIKEIDDVTNSWVYAVIGILEGYYRNQGYKRGFINGTEYLLLSERALKAKIELLCRSNSSKSCKLAKLSHSFPAAAMNLMFKEHPELANSILPDDACRLTESDEECTKQLGFSFAFKAKQAKFVRTVTDIKQLLYNSRRPLVLTMPEVHAAYFVPCSDPRVTNQDLCVHDCPLSVDSDKCFMIKYPTLLNNGQYFVPQAPAKPVLGPINNFVLVGYTDDFVPASSVHRFKSHHLPRGGFIIKGQSGPNVGNSPPLYEGVDDPVYDNRICANSNYAPNWPNCRGNDCSELDIITCTDPIYCEKGANYTLVRMNNQTRESAAMEDSSGLTTTLIKNFQTEQIEKYIGRPFWRLHDTFRSPWSRIAQSYVDSCGYWFIPYELVDLASSLSPPGSNGVVALDLPIAWTKESFNKDEFLKHGLQNSFKQHSSTGIRYKPVH